MKFLYTILFFILSIGAVFSQYITHGPIMGAVTDTGIRFFVRTDTVRSYSIEIDTDSLFSTPQSFTNTSDVLFDNSAITNISGLQADTKYYYRLIFGATADLKKGSFRTYPTQGLPANFTFVTGSCQETANMKVYDVIPTYNPLFMIHTGDFTYPSYQLPSSYPSVWSSIPLSYQKRYEELVMKDKLFPFTPLVYMPDDDDNFGASRTNHVRTSHTGSGSTANSFFIIDTILPIERENCLKGYRYFFPGYQTVDTTEGHYHSFKVANSEFFVLDTRSMADPHHLAYRRDSVTNRWVFEPSPTHSIIGTNQRNWLLNSLTNSTAQWKFIVSGVPFNPKIRKIIEAGLIVQNIVFNIGGESGTGLRLSASFAGYWGGYPNDIQALTSHIANNNITGVLMISGDTHHNVMDDGTNSVYPELNASGLSVTTTELAYQIAQYVPFLGQPPVVDSLWNGGGNGLRNTNFLNAFGKVDVYGSDSVRYCVIDEDNLALSCMTIYADGTVYNPTSITRIPNNPLKEKGSILVFPNPNKGEFSVKLSGFEKSGNFTLAVIDISGKILKEEEIFINSVNEQIINMRLGNGISNGSYYAVLRDEKGAIIAVQAIRIVAGN